MKPSTKVLSVFTILKNKFPNVSTFLTHDNPYQLLIAVILSAQCTDQRVNLVTPKLFERFPTPKDLANAPIDHIADTIKSINFFNNKAKNIQKTAALIHTHHNDKVPPDLDILITFAGVGRKTANVVLGQSFGIPGITVDTHVNRVSNRLGFTKHKDAVKSEKDLMACWPKDMWIDFSTILILHGRTRCKSQKPDCQNCELLPHCKYPINIKKDTQIKKTRKPLSN